MANGDSQNNDQQQPDTTRQEDPPQLKQFHSQLVGAQQATPIEGIPEDYDTFSNWFSDPGYRKQFHGFLLQQQQQGHISSIPENYVQFESTLTGQEYTPPGVEAANQILDQPLPSDLQNLDVDVDDAQRTAFDSTEKMDDFDSEGSARIAELRQQIEEINAQQQGEEPTGDERFLPSNIMGTEIESQKAVEQRDKRNELMQAKAELQMQEAQQDLIRGDITESQYEETVNNIQWPGVDPGAEAAKGVVRGLVSDLPSWFAEVAGTFYYDPFDSPVNGPNETTKAMREDFLQVADWFKSLGESDKLRMHKNLKGKGIDDVIENPALLPGWLAAHAGQAAPSMLPGLAAMKVLRPVSTAGQLLTATSGAAPIETGAQLQELRKTAEAEGREVEPWEKAVATASGMAAGVFEGIADRYLFNIISDTFRGADLPDDTKKKIMQETGEHLARRFSVIWKNAGKQSAVEGLTETVQQTISNIGAKYGWDPERDITEGVPEATIIGATVGGTTTLTFGTAADLVRQKRDIRSSMENIDPQFDEVEGPVTPVTVEVPTEGPISQQAEAVLNEQQRLRQEKQQAEEEGRPTIDYDMALSRLSIIGSNIYRQFQEGREEAIDLGAQPTEEVEADEEGATTEDIEISPEPQVTPEELSQMQPNERGQQATSEIQRLTAQRRIAQQREEDITEFDQSIDQLRGVRRQAQREQLSEQTTYDQALGRTVQMDDYVGELTTDDEGTIVIDTGEQIVEVPDSRKDLSLNLSEGGVTLLPETQRTMTRQAEDEFVLQEQDMDTGETTREETFTFQQSNTNDAGEVVSVTMQNEQGQDRTFRDPQIVEQVTWQQYFERAPDPEVASQNLTTSIDEATETTPEPDVALDDGDPRVDAVFNKFDQGQPLTETQQQSAFEWAEQKRQEIIEVNPEDADTKLEYLNTFENEVIENQQPDIEEQPEPAVEGEVSPAPEEGAPEAATQQQQVEAPAAESLLEEVQAGEVIPTQDLASANPQIVEAAEQAGIDITPAMTEQDFVTQLLATPPVTPTEEVEAEVSPQEEPQPEPVEQAEPAPNIEQVPIEEVQTDPDRFQNRFNPYSEETVESIITDYNEGRLDPANIPPIKVWTDPQDGNTYVVGGHSRYEAFTRLGLDNIQVQYLQDMTEQQAIEQGRIDNALGTAETIPEQANIVRGWMADEDMSKAEINRRAKQLFKNNSRIVQAFAALNPNGKAIQSYQALQRNQTGDREQAQKFAKYVGEARLRNPQLTDSHETELYDYLLVKDNRHTATQRSFLEFVGEVIDRNTLMGEFDASKPLNVYQLRPKTDAEIEYNQQLQEAKKELRQARKSLEDKISEIERRRSEGEQISEERADEVLSGLQDDVRASERALLQIRQQESDVEKQRRSQGGLFAPPEEVEGGMPADDRIFNTNAPRVSKTGNFHSRNTGIDNLRNLEVDTGPDISWVEDNLSNKQARKIAKKIAKDPDGNEVGMRSITNFFNDALGISMRPGTVNVSKKNPASFAERSFIERIRSPLDVAVFHEGGHGIHSIIQRDNPNFLEQFDWMEFINRLEQEGLSRASADINEEYFAEWVRAYIINPEFTSSFDITGQIEQAMQEDHADLLDILQDAARLYHRHAARGARAMTRSASKDRGPRKQTLGEKIPNVFDRLKFTIMGRNWVVDMFERDAVWQAFRDSYESKKEADRKARELLREVRSTEADFRLAHQVTNRIPGIVHNAMHGNGLAIYSTGDGIQISMDDIIAFRELGMNINEELAAKLTDPNAEHGTTIKLTDRPIKDLIEEIGDDWADFEWYAQHKVSLERLSQGKSGYPGMTEVAPSKVAEEVARLEEENPEFQEYFTELNDYMDTLLLTSYMGGLISRDDAINMLGAYDFYLPLDKKVERYLGKQYSMQQSGGNTSPDAGYRGLTGEGDHPMVPLLQAIEGRTYQAIDAYYQNRAMMAPIYLAEHINQQEDIPAEAKIPVNQLVTQLSLDTQVMGEVTAEEQAEIIADYINEEQRNQIAEQQGVDPDEVTLDNPIRPDQINLTSLDNVPLFRAKEPDAIHVIAPKIDGEKRYYQVNDEFMYRYYARTEDTTGLTKWFDALAKATQPLKNLLTNTIGFTGRNIPRDTFNNILLADLPDYTIDDMTAAQFVKTTLPGFPLARGITPSVLQSETTKWLEDHVDGFTIVTNFLADITGSDPMDVADIELYSNSIRESLSPARMAEDSKFKQFTREGVIPEDWSSLSRGEKVGQIYASGVNALSKPFQGFLKITGQDALATFFEEAPRNGSWVEFKQQGYSDEVAAMARDHTSGNFGERPGNITAHAAYRSMGFGNPAMQIFSEITRRMTHPDSRIRWQQGVRLGMAGMATAALWAATYAALSDNEEREKELRERRNSEKLNYMPAFGVYRMPFDYGPVGAVQTITWLTLDRIAYDKNVPASEFAKTVISRFADTPVSNYSASGITSSALQMIAGMHGAGVVEAIANKKFYWDQPIVPPFLTRYAVEEQKYVTTPRFYEILGNLSNSSPLKVQHVLNNATGYMLGKGLEYVEKIERGEDIKPADFPVGGKLVERTPDGWNAYSTQKISDINQKYLDLKRKRDRLKESHIYDTETVERIRELDLQINKLGLFHATANKLSNMYDEVKELREHRLWDEAEMMEKEMVEVAASVLASSGAVKIE